MLTQILSLLPNISFVRLLWMWIAAFTLDAIDGELTLENHSCTIQGLSIRWWAIWSARKESSSVPHFAVKLNEWQNLLGNSVISSNTGKYRLGKLRKIMVKNIACSYKFIAHKHLCIHILIHIHIWYRCSRLQIIYKINVLSC